jgi:hypothetical protein
MTKDEERRAAALRENLRRRKAQGRARLDQDRAGQEPERPATGRPTGADTPAPAALPDPPAID